ncbi:hypothetical protein KEM55_002403 [Ascosphaera atra]|nr:hypothetical protein KEM55_002403 [Ascosphaera atra]
MDSMVAAAQPENAYEAAADSVAAETPVLSKEEAEAQSKERQMDFDARLTNAIWDLATTNANPSVDLLVCLERQQPIGFRYADITSSVVIHHGERDNRVPLENVRWIGKTMRRCEVRVLEDEGHGLMASGAVMGNVLMEIAGERDAWKKVSMRERSGSATSSTAARQAVRAGV